MSFQVDQNRNLAALIVGNKLDSIHAGIVHEPGLQCNRAAVPALHPALGAIVRVR